MGGKPPDPYEVLGLVQADAPSASDVRKAYHRLARVHHPDKARTPEEENASLKRKTEQQQREINNLKHGKKGRFNQHNGGNSNNANGNGNNQNGGNGGTGGGNGGGAQPFKKIPCPPDYCKDFNFKHAGCTLGTNCRFKHKCAICGSDQHGATKHP